MEIRKKKKTNRELRGENSARFRTRKTKDAQKLNTVDKDGK
jgi:hypothetical protein